MLCRGIYFQYYTLQCLRSACPNLTGAPRYRTGADGRVRRVCVIHAHRGTSRYLRSLAPLRLPCTDDIGPGLCFLVGLYGLTVTAKPKASDALTPPHLIAEALLCSRLFDVLKALEGDLDDLERLRIATAFLAFLGAVAEFLYSLGSTLPDLLFFLISFFFDPTNAIGPRVRQGRAQAPKPSIIVRTAHVGVLLV